MASSTQSLPVSQILKSKSQIEDEPKKKSREDWRKAKELEEARKAGTAPAAVDEEGKDINPHIPQYISSAPWYYGTSGPTLKHQRPQEDKQKDYSRLDEWYKRGVDTSKLVTKYRKGACENCGAVTHKRKDCMERPRKVGAKFSGANIAADEFVQKKLSLDYDGKRDRWSGYDPSEHKSVIEEFQKVEEAKRQLKADKLNANEDSDDEKDEDKYVDEVDMPGTKVDSKQRITVRNLRIREDTAKYLRNLDPNSAYYDPKTRSMRENPNPNKDDQYSGENFVRFTGDTTKHASAQLFAWEAYERGVDVHLLAEPTKLELLQKEYEKKKEQFKSKVQGSILEKYGGEEHLEAPPKSLLLAQTEDYVEYSRSGKVIKGQEKEVIRSKYEEDVYINNHTSVWGSYWKGGRWGYKCCYSFVKNSYCLGEAGKSSGVNVPLPDVSTSESNNQIDDKQKSSESSSECSSDGETRDKTEKNKKKKNKKKKQKEKRKQKKNEEKDKLKEALKAEEEHQNKADRLLSIDERKRPYNSMFEVKKPTEEEIEAYYLKRRREEDPMNQFI
ncbi:pre-mRNA-splicing factor Slu7 [Asbolus verrucosus]|uniref:Pre-mRNA-splicing factor SLU7 n=1 Tax=Asbolus verrucosus TaxID=1661398 RepID=A0A482W7C3_ASBVE|nr:pre-mRNA-splicing factor Slu7 [Asbolus verrucosus]